jgi:aminoglycoside phosphotransferase (APT) family kinase protein
VHTVAALHQLDESRADLSFLHRPELGAAGVDQYVGYVRWYYDWARDGLTYPALDTAIDWLDRNRPAVAGPLVLNWGDARPGNILFGHDQALGVLDWEMASVGPPEVDLGFMVLFHRYFDHRAAMSGQPGMPELFRIEDVISEYSAVTGKDVGDLTWYQMLAAIRISIHHVRQVARAVEFGRLSRAEARDSTRADSRLEARHLLSELMANG